MTFTQKCYSKEKIEMEFTLFFIFGIVFLVIAGISIIASIISGYTDYLFGSLALVIFGGLLISAAVDSHEKEIENKNTEEKYNICVDAGYDVYMDGQEIDASKIIFEPDEYKVKFDDKKKKVILQEKSLR